MELAGRKNARAELLLASRVGGVWVRDGDLTGVAGQVGETRKYAPVGVEVIGAAIWQLDRPRIRKTAKANIHFDKPGLPPIKVSIRLINVQSHPLNKSSLNL